MSGEFGRGWDSEDESQPIPAGHPEEAEEGNTELPESLPTDREGDRWEEGDGRLDEEASPMPEAAEEHRLSQSPPVSPKPNGQQRVGAISGRPSPVELPRGRLGWDGLHKGRSLVKRDEVRLAFSPHERLLILDTWQRSGLPAGDFAPLVGISKHTLYAWKKQFTQHGPAGLMEKPRGATTGSKLPEVTKRTILMLKQLHAEWGCQRISDELLRGPALAASVAAVARVLHEAGYQMEERRTRPHPDQQRCFERARPNQLWQTDLFTFVLKRQNRRLYLVGFMDDHSRFVVG